MPCPGHLMLGNGLAPTVPEVGRGPQSQSGQVWKILPLLEFDPQTIQPVVSQISTMSFRPMGTERHMIIENVFWKMVALWP